MIHSFELNGYYIVLDVCSGSVHVVDELAYEMIARFEEKTLPEITAEMLTAENLSRVTVINSDTVTVLTDQICEGIYPYEGTYGFCLRDKTMEEKLQDTLDIYAGAIAELADLIAGGE